MLQLRHSPNRHHPSRSASPGYWSEKTTRPTRQVSATVSGSLAGNPNHHPPPRSARPNSDPLRSFVVVVVVDSSAVLTRNLVVPTHSCPMSACAVVLVVHESTCLKHWPVPTNLPSVIRAGVRHLAGGAPATRSGVKSSRLGLWCTRAASSLSRHHSSSFCTG